MSFIDDWWANLPESTRELDDAGGGDLRRWMTLLALQVQPVADLYDRISNVTAGEGGDPADTSDLVDPATADIAWLPWLAQFYGVTLPQTTDPVAMRDAVQYASGGWQAGTKQAMADAARSALTGTRYARVMPHWGGNPWAVNVRTRTSETPSGVDVVAVIAAKNAAPAGVLVTHDTYSIPWSLLESTYPTWTSLEAVTWDVLEETGAPSG